MARRESIQSLVESKAGECRGLAMAMRAEADALGFLKGRERRVIESWADALDLIADGLGEAIRDRDPSKLRRLLGYGGVAAMIVMQPVIEGASSAISSEVFSERVVGRAESVSEGLDAIAARADEVSVDDPTPYRPDVWPKVRQGLKPLVRALYSSGGLVGVSNSGEWEFLVPNAAHAAKCDEHRQSVERALTDAVGYPVRIAFLVDRPVAFGDSPGAPPGTSYSPR